MALTRVLRTAPATLTHTWYVGESETDPTGTPTVAVTAADGEAVQSGDATVVGSGSGRTTFALDPVSTLEYLTVTWTATVAGVARVETDYAEIVGGFFFSLADGRGSDSSLSDDSVYSEAALESARIEVESECEHICDRAFVPRYARVTLDGTGTTDVMLEHPADDRSMFDVRSLRSVSTAERADETFTALTADELAAVVVTEAMTLRRVDGDVWPEGLANVVVELEYGLDTPPPDLRRGALVRLRSTLNIHKSGVAENALSYNVDGVSYRLSTPGAYRTGLLNVDAAYARYSRRPEMTPGGRPVPASRQLTYNSSRHRLYPRY